MSAQPSQSTIQKIKNEGAEYEPNRFVEAIGGEIDVGALQQRAFENFECGGEPTK